MLIAIKEPNEKIAYKVVSEITLEMLQELVGGYIEVYSTIAMQKIKLVAVINEEGKLRGMTPNFWAVRDIIVGPAVFVGRDGENFGSLTESQVNYLNRMFVETLNREGWEEVK